METVRNNLKNLRQAADLSQASFAKKIGSQQPQVARWEKQPGDPKYRQIPLDKAIVAAEVLNVALWKIRPDVATKDSVDPLMEGLSEAAKKEVRDYIIFKREQEHIGR